MEPRAASASGDPREDSRPWVPSFFLNRAGDPPTGERDYTLRTAEYRPHQKLLKHQAQFLISPVRQTGIFGGYGGGKTVALCRGLGRVCAINGVEHRRKNSLPVARCALISPTYRTLMESTVATFYEVTDRRWIRKVRGQPSPHIELTNDVIIELHSALSTLEGSNYFAIAVDETQHKNYTETHLRNCIARVRDGNAIFRSQLFAGISEAGHAQALFDRPPTPPDAADGGNWTIMVASTDNPFVDEQTLHAILATCSSEEAADIVKGRWHQPKGALFGNFSAGVHLTKEPGKPHEPTHLGIDPKGKLLAVMFGQKYAVRAPLPNYAMGGLAGFYEDVGVHVVDQLLPENTGMEGVCQLIRAHPRKWPIGQGSIITVDPTIAPDDRNTLRRFFPGARVIEATSHNGAVEDRVSNTCRALRDGQGMVRVKIWDGLRGAKRGVIEACEGERRHETSGRRVQDNFLEHAGDAFMYLLEGLLPRQHALAPPDIHPSIKPRAIKRR